MSDLSQAGGRGRGEVMSYTQHELATAPSCVACEERGRLTLDPSVEHLEKHARETDVTLTKEALAATIREAKAEAWEEGVATALNYAKRGSDGITLKLVTFDGDAWRNPYRAAEIREKGEQ